MIVVMSSAAQALAVPKDEWPDVSEIVTEDDIPVDNFASEKQQRLLTEPLYSSWTGPPPSPDPEADHLKRTFVAAANVGVFVRPKDPPVVPDVLLSLDVELAEDLWKKENRTYFIWEMGKPPDVVIEIVSNRVGGELDAKRHKYARMGVPYYVVWDPQSIYGEPTLRAFFKHGGAFYTVMNTLEFRDVGLSLVLWEGAFEDLHRQWLRWADLDGNLILTGAEKAKIERKRADDERKRADDEQKRADDEQKRADDEQKRADDEQKRADDEQKRADSAQARADAAQARANRLADKLRALGIDPNGDG
jgi:Uma2 family endonuclease